VVNVTEWDQVGEEQVADSIGWLWSCLSSFEDSMAFAHNGRGV
jgi:hypothetical protein